MIKTPLKIERIIKILWLLVLLRKLEKFQIKKKGKKYVKFRRDASPSSSPPFESPVIYDNYWHNGI